jgi:hypothetical protein
MSDPRPADVVDIFTKRKALQMIDDHVLRAFKVLIAQA